MIAETTQGQRGETLRLYSIADARRILGQVGKTWLYAEIAAGRLRPIKLGTRTMISNRELERYIAAREQESRP